MKQKRLCESYNLVINNKMATTKFGTVNKKNPVVVYISLGTWLYTKGNHKQYLISLEDTVRRLIKTYLLNDGLFAQRYLLEYDVCLDPFRNGAKHFLSLDLYLKQNSTTILSMRELLPSVTERTSKFVDELIDNLEDSGFTVSKTKK